MINSSNILIGSGMSSLVFYKNSKKQLQVISQNTGNIFQRKNFYEYDGFGGNSNIWGGYINFKKHKIFLKRKIYNRIFNKGIFKVKKIFNNSSPFVGTYSLVDQNNEIFKVKKSYFKKKILDEKIEKIKINKNFLELKSSMKTFRTKNLILCIGNLNLIKLLNNSGIVRDDDIISFDDGECSYVLNFMIDFKKNYYIPMPLNKIVEKIIFKRSVKYPTIYSSIILQKFTKKFKNYKFSCKNLLNDDKKKLRYFLSNHVVNLKINNIPIRKFILNKSKKIDIFCSGVLKKYSPGPIIQDLIYDICKK